MRSRWIFLTFALCTAGVCTYLGFWQVSRHRERAGANALAEVARRRPVVVLPGPSDEIIPLAPVTLTGEFDHEQEIVLRGRAHHGAPGVEVATPFRLAGGSLAVIVIRGFVPSDDAFGIDRGAIREPGPRTIHGEAFALDSSARGGLPIIRRSDTTWQRVDRADLGRLPYPVMPLGVRQTKDSGMTGFPIRLGAPALSAGPHLSYAIQWFGFALIFAGGGIAYTFRQAKESD
ncbi:MAG: SURF1 family protein [Actinomycetota bacterium]|nr:SURF1 family protein [Actinomycetota bacterium]